ncbi:MAG: tRNA pseudouridine(38-40) synthase TruA [Betaproteobacteria bacterium RIFCSPLOWO2_02_FULL_62_17]|nr:MAG: tRNA pseudouridine(38-40) synthase TruA [Betaproteobacteria bacterium RIFCSPLOWO2_02_FULL_62_17]
MRIAIGVSYDGRGFEGWQSQPSGKTVQDHLEAALGQIAAAPLRVNGAGRTDSGVHALGQVAHFDCDASRPASAWVRGANALLPGAIGVQWAMPISDEFNARFSAIARRYVYLLYVHPVRPSVLAGKAGWYHAPLDLDAMRGAAAMLVGKHDFSAFRSSQCQAKTPVRNLTRCVIHAQGPYLIFEITADAFLHHMVRNLVGCLLYIGKGAHPAAWIGQVLAGRDRKQAAPTICADGLYLAEVRYEDRWKLPEFPRMMPQLDLS